MKKLITVEYNSNNSGGCWWLQDKDWKALEKAGWEVEWGGLYFCHSNFPFNTPPKGKKNICESSAKCQGHRRFTSWKKMTKDDRWLGCLAKAASKQFTNITEALKEFEKVTGQNVTDEGCNCCSPPHSFRWKDEEGNGNCGNGSELLLYLYPEKKIPSSLREAVENQIV